MYLSKETTDKDQNHKMKTNLTDLPYVVSLEILNFLTVFDIINLYTTSKLFIKRIFNTQYKSILRMNNLCSDKTWNEILNTNFSNFLGRLREELQDDLGTFLSLSYRLYSFILDNRLSLHTTFVDFCFCKRTCDKKKVKRALL